MRRFIYLPVERANHLILHWKCRLYQQDCRTGSGKYLIEWLSEALQEFLAAEALRSQFYASDTGAQSFDLAGEEGFCSSVQSSMQLEWYLSMVPWKFTSDRWNQRLVTNALTRGWKTNCLKTVHNNSGNNKLYIFKIYHT